MKLLFSARLGAYLAVFGVLGELVISWEERADHSYREPFVHFPIAMPVAYGILLLLRHWMAQFWERDDLFKRATQPAIISSASVRLEAGLGDALRRFSPRVRRHLPPNRYCLKLPALGLLYTYVLIIPFAALMLSEGYISSWRASQIVGLRAYVAGPSGWVQPWAEPAYEKLIVKVTFQPEWFLGSKRITEAEANRIWRKPVRSERCEVKVASRLRWYLNSKPMAMAALQRALKETLSQRRVRVVYLDVDHDAPFQVAVEAIEAAQQTPDTKVVLVTNGAR